MEPDYTLDWILPFVRESLRDRGNFNYEGYADALWAVLERMDVHGVARNLPTRGYTGTTYDFSQADPRLRMAAAQALFHLIHSGLVVPNPPSTRSDLMLGPAAFYMTARGTLWALGHEPVPEDSTGYMKSLRALVPTLDLVIEQYISEGISSFIRRNYFAAAVMIGAASEKALYLLADSMVGALVNAAQVKKLEELLGERRLNRLFSFVEKSLEKAHSAHSIPYQISEGCYRQLNSLMESIRVQRNDAVHPMNAQVSADSVRLSYAVFPQALAKLEAIRMWLSANPSSI